MSTIEKGRVVGGKFRLEARLAGGGMGSIWRGWDVHLDAPVAVKFMRRELAESGPQRARFEREAKAAAQIRSPHVVHIYDHGIDGDTPYIVMELLEGEDLAQRLKRERQLAVADVVRICTEVCRGLHRAHRRDIVHRDLKPGNVFLSAPDDDLVKILDFGIAKAHSVHAVGSEATTTGQLLGSPHYMSPEQARGMALDGRSDLWSLAVILYRGLTGHHPFRGVEIGDLIVRICTDAVPPPSSYRPGLGAPLDAFFARAFQKEPSSRFQTAKELAAAFGEAARDAAAAAVDAAAVSESSWDSTGSPHPSRSGSPAPVGEEDPGASVTPPPERGGPAPAVRAEPTQPLPVVEPTPTGDSGTLGSVLAGPRPKRRWGLFAAAGALLVAGTAVAVIASMGAPAESGPASASPAGTATGMAAPDGSERGATTAATQASPSNHGSTETPGGTSLAAGASGSQPSASTSRPRAAPVRRPRPSTPPRPQPGPAPTKTSPGYQPSDLGY